MAAAITLRTVILRFISEHGYSPRVADVARLIGRPHNRTDEALGRLEKAGQVRRFRGRVWVVR